MAEFLIVAPVLTPPVTGADPYSYEMEALAPIGAKIVECQGTEAEFIAAAKEAAAVYVRRVKVTRRAIEALDRCRIIAVGSVGVDYVDVAAATEKGIPVTNCPDTFIEEVADHTMMLLLAAHRRALDQDRMVREGRWADGRRQLLQIPRLIGQTLGFVAFGRVPRAVAHRASSFGLRIMAYDPFVDERTIVAAGAEPASLSEVLQASDFLSVHLPATPQSVGMLGKRHFRQMKGSAIIINTGRGSTLVEEDLITALQEQWIAGAALDVFEKEPVQASNPLLRMTNVILSPHNASASARFEPVRRRRVGQELALVLTGRWPMSCVNPSVLARTDLKRWQPISMERGSSA
jgi:D-3-phosphoglycerate dehydrogenase / 2-oxoglutarate reductase